jgi:hypothetical protein
MEPLVVILILFLMVLSLIKSKATQTSLTRGIQAQSFLPGIVTIALTAFLLSGILKIKPSVPWRIKFFDERYWLKVVIIRLFQIFVILFVLMIWLIIKIIRTSLKLAMGVFTSIYKSHL